MSAIYNTVRRQLQTNETTQIRNFLPEHIVSAPTLQSFRRHLKTFLLQQSFCLQHFSEYTTNLHKNHLLYDHSTSLSNVNTLGFIFYNIIAYMVATTLPLCFYVLCYYVLCDVRLSHLNKRLLTYCSGLGYLGHFENHWLIDWTQDWVYRL